MIRHSKEEKQTHISLWQESGLSKRAYSKEAGIKYRTFLLWIMSNEPSSKKCKPKAKKVSSFIPIALSEETTMSAAHSASAQIEIRYPNGVHVLCPAGVDISVLKSLLS
ncbi:MAG: IS66 family insertion sequence element accessory protein TnpA [Flavobacteriales bacterium]